MTLYNLTQQDAKTLLNHCENNIETLAIILYDRCLVKSLKSGINKAKRIKVFANKINNLT
jgi:hypothetical protein